MIVDADAQVQFNGPIGILVSYTSSALCVLATKRLDTADFDVDVACCSTWLPTGSLAER